jgi:hypothetical protein
LTSRSLISFHFSILFYPLYVHWILPYYTHTYIYIYTYNKNIHTIYMILYAFYISYYIYIYVYFKHSLIFLTYTFHEDWDFQQHTPGISRPYTFSQGFSTTYSQYIKTIHNSSRGGVRAILPIGHIGLYTVLSYSTALICIVLYWTYNWPNMERYIIKPYIGLLLYVYHTSTHIPYYGMPLVCTTLFKHMSV